MQSNITTLIGSVASEIRLSTTDEGIHIARFRLVCTHRKWDREAARWMDTDPSFLSVVCRRRLAESVGESLAKGDPVVVVGRLNIRQWENAGHRMTAVEVDAHSVAPDLARIKAHLRRRTPALDRAA